MNRKELTDLFEPLLLQVRKFIEERIAALPPAKDGAPGKDGRDGVDGKDGAPGAVGERGLQGERGDVGERGPAGADGAPGAQGNEGPAGADGKHGRDGIDGKDAVPPSREDIAAIARSIIEPEFKSLASGLPIPKDGRDGADGREGEKGDRGEPGERGPPGADGAPGPQGKGVTPDDVLPLLQASVATWMLDFEKRAQATLQRAIDSVPRPRDGVDGKNGLDGLSIENLDVSHNGDGLVTLAFSRGDVRREFSLQIPRFSDRGVHKDGGQYLRGDGVTARGCFWIAQKDSPSGRPGEPESDWRLAVKSGRDGKDGGAPATSHDSGPVKIR